MDEAAERAHGFWRWYLRQGWERPLRASFYLFLYVVFLGILAYAAIRDYRGREFWLFFIRNPFFYLMWVTLISSYIDLGYMRYRLQQSGYPSEFLGDGIMEQEAVPKQYQKMFGKDRFVRFWNVRWLYMIFGLIAGVQYIFR